MKGNLHFKLRVNRKISYRTGPYKNDSNCDTSMPTAEVLQYTRPHITRETFFSLVYCGLCTEATLPSNI